MADAELLRLIDLSLGKEPCGVVNYNYMHTLMHEIVRRLTTMEDLGGGGGGGLSETVKSLTGLSDKQEVGKMDLLGEEEEEAVKGGGDSTGSLVGPDGRKGGMSAHMRRASSRMLRPRTSLLTAANDMGALDRKLSELEVRMEAVESLPDLLDKRASDSSATPVNDMWNSIQMNKRMDAAEQGLQKTANLVDELLGEFNAWKEDLPKIDALKESLDSLRSEVAENNSAIKKVEDMIKLLENIQPGEGLLSSLADLKARMDTLQEDTEALKEDVGGHTDAAKQFVTWTGLEDALKAHQRPKTPPPLKHPSLEALEALKKVGVLADDFDSFCKRVEEVEVQVSRKLDADMLPKDDGGLESMMPMVLEMQSKLAYIESELSSKAALPPETLNQIGTMEKAIDALMADLVALSSQVAQGSSTGRVEELGAQVAQMRERLAEMDRAVTALANTVAQRPETAEAEEAPSAFVDVDTFVELQGMVSDMKQHQDRLLDTAAHLSNELGVNQAHVKNLYGAVDEVKEGKADKETVQIEVDEKADRKALEAKASRHWVESTFETLDREIREAKSQLAAQDEQLRGNMDRITNDIETKLDREEMETLRDYIERKLKDAKQPIIHQPMEPEGDDAAGFKKPMKVRCISCDKPIGVKTNQSAPLSLPQGQVMPPQKTFRPYTTYELELIRQHQRVSLMQHYPGSARHVGGSHTLTHPHRRMRVAPLNSQYASELYQTLQGPSMQEEVSVVGHDGQMYKGRLTRRLPGLYTKSKTTGRRPVVPRPPGQRPSTSPQNLNGSVQA